MAFPTRRYPEAEDMSLNDDEVELTARLDASNNEDCLENVVNQSAVNLEQKCEQALNTLIHCEDGINIYLKTFEALEEEVLKPGNSLFKLEDTLLSLATNESVDGIFFYIAFELADNSVTSRQFESGCFESYCENGVSKIEETFGYKCVAPVHIYTRKDILMEKERSTELYRERTKSATPHRHTFQRLVYGNENSVEKTVQATHISLQKLKNIKFLNMFVLVLHKNQKWKETLDSKGKSMQRYAFSFPENHFSDLESHLMEYRGNSLHNRPPEIDIWSNFNPPLSPEVQFKIINALPNFHKYPWDKLVKYLKHEQRMPTTTRVYPGSPRNRILQAAGRRLNPLPIIHDVLMNLAGCKIPVKYPTKAKRKRSTSLNANSDEMLAGPSNLFEKEEAITKSQTQSDGETENEVEIQTNPSSDETAINQVLQEEESREDASVVVVVDQALPREVSLYQFFTSELFHRGILCWRVLEEQRHVVVMNSYHPETGDFQEYEYCKVTGEVALDGYSFSCTCPCHANSIISGQTSCCHTRLLKDIFACLQGQPLAYINIDSVHKGMAMVNQSIVQLASKTGVDRFSVNSPAGNEFVTLFNVAKTSRTIVSCHSAICKIAEGATRRVFHLEKSEVLCDHLAVFREFYLKQLKDNFACEEEHDENENEEFDEYDTEIPSTLPDEKWNDVFDDFTGMWKFSPKSPSQSPVDSNPRSETLKNNFRKRSDTYEYEPKLPTGPCACGAGWSSDEFPTGLLRFSHTINIYSCNDVQKCEVSSRLCVSESCVINWDGAEDSVFCLTPSTAAGYEIGWEFVDLVMASHMTFRGYVGFVNSRYDRLCDDVVFMSVNTFINWFFGWASRMDIDFRVPCSYCGDSPKLLACDGTKLGIGFRNCFVSPIETSSEAVGAGFQRKRRHDRCFIYNKSKTEEGKRHFALVRATLREIAECAMKNVAVDSEKCQFVRPMLPLLCLEAFDRMVAGEQHLRKAFGIIFKLLSYSSAVDAMIPLSVCDEVINCSTEANDIATLIRRLRSISYECANLLELTSGTNAAGDALILLKYCATFVKEVHSSDIKPAPSNPIPGSYNPGKFGRAYYFSSHGQQIRRMRRFPADDDSKKSRKEIFDDVPDVLCQKRFPQVSKQGISYLFLWFCPQHGHCYGFHVIPGSEGRKDPHASLYTHLETAPSKIFYDFACGLSEYTKNREAGYFQKTDFYHDIFHGFTHICSPSFKCNKLQFSANTSICEQFNAFIKKIKTSSKLMSQCHFAFYLQFFIHIWNKQKHGNFKRRHFISDASKI